MFLTVAVYFYYFTLLLDKDHQGFFFFSFLIHEHHGVYKSDLICRCRSLPKSTHLNSLIETEPHWILFIYLFIKRLSFLSDSPLSLSPKPIRSRSDSTERHPLSCTWDLLGLIKFSFILIAQRLGHCHLWPCIGT